MIQRESTSPTFSFFLISLACIALFVFFFSFNLSCGRNRSDEIKHISCHTESYRSS